MENHKAYIGTSGWSYKHWEGTFYPEKLPKKNQFAHYRSLFNTVEINASFYRLPQKETMQKWKDQAEPDFNYVLKASRYITHLKRLLDPKESLDQFLDHAAILEDRLAAILFQLPPGMKRDLERLEAFLKLLPKAFRYTFEFRNSDWYCDETYRLLQKYNCAFCIYELGGHSSPIVATADFVYIRLHGPGRKYQGSYPEETLQQWASLCREWLKEKDVFVYFDNDEKGYAAFNALRLQEILKSNPGLNKIVP